MKVVLSEHECVVTCEDTDPIFYTSGWGTAESRLLYHVKKELIAQGHDVIKKRMWKDGHLVDEDCQYVRTRDFTDSRGIMVWNGNHQIYDAGERFNEDGAVTLHVDRWGAA